MQLNKRVRDTLKANSIKPTTLNVEMSDVSSQAISGKNKMFITYLIDIPGHLQPGTEIICTSY